jgi:hypothetical protein
MKKTASLLLSFLLPALLFAQNGTPYNPDQGSAGVADVADSDPGLFFFMIVIALLFIGIILATCILLLLLAAIASVLVLCGVVSVSVVAGWHQQSFSKGVAFFIKCCTVLIGSLIGLVASPILIKLFHNASGSLVVALSTLAGALFGLMIAKICLKAMQLMIQTVISKSKQFLQNS